MWYMSASRTTARAETALQGLRNLPHIAQLSLQTPTLRPHIQTGTATTIAIPLRTRRGSMERARQTRLVTAARAMGGRLPEGSLAPMAETRMERTGPRMGAQPSKGTKTHDE